jgi:hypothetical protein
MNKNISYLLPFLNFANKLVGCGADDSKVSSYAPTHLVSIYVINLQNGNYPMTMSNDGETSSEMYPNKVRYFCMKQPILIIQKGKDSVQISLYSKLDYQTLEVFSMT